MKVKYLHQQDSTGIHYAAYLHASDEERKIPGWSWLSDRYNSGYGKTKEEAKINLQHNIFKQLKEDMYLCYYIVGAIPDAKEYPLK